MAEDINSYEDPVVDCDVVGCALGVGFEPGVLVEYAAASCSLPTRWSEGCASGDGFAPGFHASHIQQA